MHTLSEKTTARVLAGFAKHLNCRVPVDRMLTVAELTAQPVEEHPTAPEMLIGLLYSPFCGTVNSAHRERGAGGLALALSEEVEIDG